tara:strand:- start:229 stop:879 length:651 start_codon:yes stop_codon:yes gene_type:complete
MLYIFAGFPKKGRGARQHLHAGGLQFAIETVEELAILEHSQRAQYRKEGVFINDTEEYLYPVQYRISDQCLREGITWDWFPQGWAFGNGVTMHKTHASPEFKTVVHGTNLSLDEFLALHGPTKLSELELVRRHNRHESWRQYEARWLPRTCPQANHVVHLTWLVTTHRLPAFAYARIQALIEDGAEPNEMHRYSTEPGKHFSEIRQYTGAPAHTVG